MSTPTPNDPKPESKVEAIKRSSRHLRGTIAETLASDATHFGEGDTVLLKFHGSYQQDDRDTRRTREAEGKEKAWSFMVRLALPAGVLTAAQYLAFDAIAGRYADGTLRITTRQGFQYHGIIKGALKTSIAEINAALATTLSACGDVSRNVLGCPAERGGASAAVRALAADIAVALRPGSRAYHELWLDGEKQPVPADEEPFYGEQYLPRKFKVAVALDTDNCTDAYAQCLGLVAITEGGDAVRGFNIVVGGGLGMTHNKGDTIARLGDPLVFVTPEHAVAAARLVAAIYRDHGNRSERRHARLKYLITERGLDWFRTEFAQRADFPWSDPVAVPVPVFHDHLGRERQPDGAWSLGVFVQSGRIADTPAARIRAGLHEAVSRWQPEVRLTAQQNILFVNLDDEQLHGIESVLREHGISLAEQTTPVRRGSMACPALPTCSLAVAESERALPSVLDELEETLVELGVDDVPLTVRMTGCPNGCARPYTADLAFVGRTLDKYQIYVGGRQAGDRVADLFLAEVPQSQLVTALRPLLQRWSAERTPDEGLGDFYQRLSGQTIGRRQITGKELPTAASLSLVVPA
jgi:sulfite reductase beta subunit-like hemoprotein